MEQNYKTRHRVNISTSVKGIKTYDATVELIDSSVEEVLAESDKLIVQLDKRYPPQMEK